MFGRKDHRAPESCDFALEIKLAEISDDVVAGTFSGYASVFGLLDRGGDIVQPGAFKNSLKEWKKKKRLPSMLWSHDPDNVIGKWIEIAEDEKGLKVKGELILDVPQAKVVHALLKRDAVSGMSIGYRTQDYEYDRTTGARFLKKVDLWEISLVSMPMLEEALIDAVKAMKTFNPRDAEAALRDAGLSRADAKKATAAFQTLLQRDAGGPGTRQSESARDCLMSMRRAVAALRA